MWWIIGGILFVPVLMLVLVLLFLVKMIIGFVFFAPFMLIGREQCPDWIYDVGEWMIMWPF